MRSIEETESSPSIFSSIGYQRDVPSESYLKSTPGLFHRKSLPTETKPSTLKPTPGKWDDLTTWSAPAWSAQSRVSESWAAKAQAWETQALEAQARVALKAKNNIMEEAAMMVPEQESSEELIMMSKKDSDVLPPRPFWSSKAEYMLVLMSYLVRPYSMWHFAIQCLHRGGCIFLVVYILMLFCIGIPLLFLEMAVGQRTQQASVNLWKTLGPWFSGVGYSIFMVCLITNTYTNLFNSWIIFYLSHIFDFIVPWEQCPFNRRSNNIDPECEQGTSYTYFWYRQTLNASSSIENGGPPAFHLGMLLFLSWCLSCVFMSNGIKSVGKVIYVLVLLPCLIFFCFVVRTLSMEGIDYGLKYLLILKVASIYDITMWSQAVIQVVLDMGLGFGPIISLSSHMPPFNNCYGDAFLVALIRILTLVFILPFILSVLGFWATITTHQCCEKNIETLIKLVGQGTLPPEVQPPSLKDNPTSTYNSWLNSLPPSLRSTVLSKVPECSIHKQFLKIKEGPHFVFLTFVEVTSLYPGSSFWTTLFFLFLLSLGLCTSITFLLGVIIPLQDTFSFFRKQPRLLLVGVSMVMFLCGLFFVRPSGIYYFGLLTEYWVVLPLVVIIICENLAVAWAYRAKRFLADMTALLNRPISPVCGWLWLYVSPVVLVCLLVVVIIRIYMGPLTYVAWDSNTSKEVILHHPRWSVVLISGLAVFVLFPISAYFVYCLVLRIPFSPAASSKLSLRNDKTLPKKESSASVQGIEALPKKESSARVQGFEALPKKESSASVQGFEALPKKESSASVQGFEALPKKESSASVQGFEALPKKESSASVQGFEALPKKESSASVQGFEALPKKESSASVQGFEALPKKESSASVQGFETMSSSAYEPSF